MANWFKYLTEKVVKNSRYAGGTRLLSYISSGSLYKISDLRSDNAVTNIKSQIDRMRALAEDSQVSTTLDYYATDATTANASGLIIWATPISDEYKQVADIINAKFKQWKVNSYARDHLLELATIGNLYIPTTHFYREEDGKSAKVRVSLDGNTIKDEDFDIVPSTKIPPETILHLWQQGRPVGYVLQPDEQMSDIYLYPEEAVVHFALGGLVGDYTISAKTRDGEDTEYDIQFATPLLAQAVQPTQTLSLLEDASILSQLSRLVKILNVECGNAEEEEIQATLQTIKSMVEQQLSLNTASGDVQSYVNPQSPNNLLYVPRINGQDPISITDLDMSPNSDADNDLLNYYQDKKLSVLGIPKEALNFSSSEGLGGAGSVMSQRSALYANRLQRLETAYIEGWKSGINSYFKSKNLSGYVDKFELHMNPIVTEMSTVNFDRRDAALGQAQTLVELVKGLGVTDEAEIKNSLVEILSEVLPATGNAVTGWDINVEAGGEMDEI